MSRSFRHREGSGDAAVSIPKDEAGDTERIREDTVLRGRGPRFGKGGRERQKWKVKEKLDMSEREEE